MVTDFFQGKKVLITGHTGFKGAWLSLLLAKLGAQVHGFSLPNENLRSMYHAAQVGKVLKTELLGNLLDSFALHQYITRVKPDLIFHLAAQSLVSRSFAEPIETLETNIVGTFKLLDAALKHAPEALIINVTSDKCYLNKETGKSFTENDCFGGDDIYSASKASVEIISKAFFLTYGSKSNLKLANVRAGNVIGGGDWNENRLVPDIFRAMDINESLVLRMPQSIRPWQFVLDPLLGYLYVAQYLTMQSGAHYDAWNFGPDSEGELTVSELVRNFQNINPKLQVKEENNSIFGESNILKLDNSKAKVSLNWHPALNIENTVKFTSDWYQMQNSGGNMQEFSDLQINKFLEISNINA